MKMLKYIIYYIYNILTFYVNIIHFIIWNRQMNKAEKQNDYILINEINNRLHGYITFESYPILIFYLVPYLSLYFTFIDKEILTITIISSIVVLFAILRSYEHINPKIIN